MAHLLAAEAESDLDKIWLYIARESGDLEAADRVVDSITARFFLLATHPYLGRRRDEDLRRPGLRSFPIGRYIVFYRVTDENDVSILRILAADQDINAIL